MLNKKSTQVCKYHFKDSFRISLWFLAIYAASIITITIVSKVMNEDQSLIDILETFGVAVAIFIFVIGIVNYSTYIKSYVYQGVTRRDSFVGMALSMLLLSLFFAVLILITDIVVIVASGDNIIISVLAYDFIISLVAVYIGYMLGMIIGISYVGHGLVMKIGSIVLAVLGGNFVMNSSYDILGIVNNGGNTIWLYFVALLAIGIAITVANYFLSRNVDLKVDSAAI